MEGLRRGFRKKIRKEKGSGIGLESVLEVVLKWFGMK